MVHEREDAESLRRRLYRPGASAADLASYLHVAEVEPPMEAERDRTRATASGTSIRPFAVGAVCVAAAAVLGGVLLSGGFAGPAGTATPPAPTVTGDGASWRVTFVQAAVLDGGARVHARGPSVADGPDRYRYTVADGDTVSAIARRFDLCTSDVIVALPYGFSAAELPAGSSLELGRTTSDGEQEFHNGTC